MKRLLPLLLASAIAPAAAADYVQAPGSTLTFATKYQGEVFCSSTNTILSDTYMQALLVGTPVRRCSPGAC